MKRYLLALLLALSLSASPAMAQTERSADIVSLRTENTKTYDSGDGTHQVVVSMGAVHYKDDYSDPTEPWKDIDLTPDRSGNITKAPYELTQERGVYTLRNKKTGKVSTIEPTFVNADATLKVIPEPERVRFQYEITKDQLPFEARYTVTGTGFDSRAYDDIGELSLTTALKAGVLTERLEAVIDKATESTRDIVGKIRIDPTWQVGASTDDAYRQLSNNYWNLTYAYFGAGAVSGTNWQVGSGARFTNITIAQGAVITAASLTFRAAASMNGADALTRISAEDVDDAATFADNAAAFDARWANRTTARVDWDNIAAWTSGVDYNSPEIKTVIQEIVDRPLWVSGNDLVIFWEDFDDRSAHVVNNRRLAQSWDGSAEFCPKLVITYVTISAPTVVTNAESNITTTGATLSGSITATGGEDAGTRGFEWDTDSGAPYANDWNEAGAYGVGAYTHNLSGLVPNTTYYYRAYATNSGGTGYGAERSFTTAAIVPAFTATYIDDGQIDLNWTAPGDSVNVTIRAKIGVWPSSITDGYQVYSGNLTTASDTSQDFGSLDEVFYIGYSDNGTAWNEFGRDSAGGIMLLLGIFLLASVGITAGMAMSKERMLGFVCLILWALTGGLSFLQSTATWDIYYTAGFSFMLLGAVLGGLGAYGLREKRDAIGDREMERGEGKFIDEKPEKQEPKEKNWFDEIEQSRRSSGYGRARTQRRKGEFDF